MSDQFDQAMVSRIGHNQVTIGRKDNSLRATNPDGKDFILARIFRDQVNGIISQRNDEDVAALILDHIIGNGKDSQFFNSSIGMNSTQ